MDMMDMKAWKKLRDLKSDSGQDLLEYALLVGLVVLVAVGAVTQVGNTINGVFWSYIASANV